MIDDLNKSLAGLTVKQLKKVLKNYDDKDTLEIDYYKYDYHTAVIVIKKHGDLK